MAFKVAQLAKDLGIKSKQITELMAARGIECKTTQKSLDAREFDIIFGALTKEKQIVDIDGYLFGDTYIPTVAKPQPQKAPAKSEDAGSTAPAVAQKAPAEPKEAAPEVKSAPKTEAAKAPAPSKEPVVENKEVKEPVAPPRAQGPRTYNIPQNLRATISSAPRAAAGAPQRRDADRKSVV